MEGTGFRQIYCTIPVYDVLRYIIKDLRSIVGICLSEIQKRYLPNTSPEALPFGHVRTITVLLRI
jgi:hypothetical protein